MLHFRKKKEYTCFTACQKKYTREQEPMFCLFVCFFFCAFHASTARRTWNARHVLCTGNKFCRLWCISQFQLRPAQPPPPPPPGYCGAFSRLVSPGGGAFANFVLPGGRTFAKPGANPNFWYAHGFLPEDNYAEDFTGITSRLADLSRTGKNWRSLCRYDLDFTDAFLHCLSRQNYITQLRSYRRESTFFRLLNQVSLDII